MLFLTVGLTMMSYGVTGLRYTRGHNVTVPPSAPLLDQVIWKLFHACLWSLFALAMAVGWVRYAQNRRVRR